MSKNLVVLLDGTWNKPESLTGNGLTGDVPTNVYRTWLGLGGSTIDKASGSKADALDAIEDVPAGKLIYIQGVGADGDWAERKVQGAAGIGVAHRMKTAYHRLSQVYRPGDRLFIFGFSRGALAARSLTAMLQHCGLMDGMTRTNVESAFEAYRRGETIAPTPVPVEYLGLWDTVAAIQLPESMTRFHLVQPTNAKRVRHALALDEVRTHFEPVLWSADKQTPGVAEAWFCGAHSNIGGGYENAGLSNIALFWLLEGAKRSGLNIDLPAVTGFDDETVARPDNSHTDFWRELPLIGKAIVKFRGFAAPRRIPAHHFIHLSVIEAFERIAGYVPQALTHAGETLTKETVKARLIRWGIRDDGTLE